MDKEFVFISYAHKNSDKVLPCVEAMKDNGIHLWYDDGIEAGSEWPEYIAEKVMNCTRFVLFISNAYLDSQNCKRELNFAISRKKEILAVFLETVELSPGMEMQLGTYQAIYRNRFESDAAFRHSLSNERYFDICREMSQPVQESQPAPQPAAPAYDMSPSVSAGESIQRNPHSSAYDQSVSAVEQNSGYMEYSERPQKSRMMAVLLAVFLGGIGIHKFYLRKTKQGILYLLFCWTYIPGILALIEAAMIFFSTDARFEEKYNCRAI